MALALEILGLVSLGHGPDLGLGSLEVHGLALDSLDQDLGLGLWTLGLVDSPLFKDSVYCIHDYIKRISFRDKQNTAEFSRRRPPSSVDDTSCKIFIISNDETVVISKEIFNLI